MSNTGPTKETIDLMMQTFKEVAPNLNSNDQCKLLACISIATDQYNSANNTSTTGNHNDNSSNDGHS